MANIDGSAPYAGAFFPRASGFNIHGGVFTSNVTKNVYSLPPEQSAEFQTIRLGDMKLVKEVRLSPQSGVVGRQIQGAGVRRIFHAEIRRDPGTVTVAMYQGGGAEEKWRQHVANYKSIRHPRIMQPYGLVITEGLYAIVFHDELIPYGQFLRYFQHSLILSTYILGYCPIIEATEFEEAANYIADVFRKPLIDYNNPPVWIQPRTGELCLDLARGGSETCFELPWWQVHVLRVENVSLDALDSEDMIISSFSEDQYHKLCSGYPIARTQCFQVSTEHPVGPGIFRSDSQHGTRLRITEPLILPEAKLYWNGGAPGELLPNSYDACGISTLELELQLLFSSYEIQKAWLAQANHIFAELQEQEHVEDYVCVDEVRFILRIADKSPIDPEGYLFWPACPAYWSLDQSGAARLSTEDARILGFPTIHIQTIMAGRSWDRSVYKGLRRFHKGKGLDPESREVASQLGYLLYEVSKDVDSDALVPAREVEHWWCEFEDPTLCRELGHCL
ncbi:hypothetical protein C8R45DRAFT_1107339 [Mycena sanguinolenta]|nr:hypothetical protein C8R45DRAFT_1107339 [Mycena sanguinolenta]